MLCARVASLSLRHRQGVYATWSMLYSTEADDKAVSANLSTKNGQEPPHRARRRTVGCTGDAQTSKGTISGHGWERNEGSTSVVRANASADEARDKQIAKASEAGSAADETSASSPSNADSELDRWPANIRLDAVQHNRRASVKRRVATRALPQNRLRTSNNDDASQPETSRAGQARTESRRAARTQSSGKMQTHGAPKERLSAKPTVATLSKRSDTLLQKWITWKEKAKEENARELTYSTELRIAAALVTLARKPAGARIQTSLAALTAAFRRKAGRRANKILDSIESSNPGGAAHRHFFAEKCLRIESIAHAEGPKEACEMLAKVIEQYPTALEGPIQSMAVSSEKEAEQQNDDVRSMLNAIQSIVESTFRPDRTAATCEDVLQRLLRLEVIARLFSIAPVKYRSRFYTLVHTLRSPIRFAEDLVASSAIEASRWTEAVSVVMLGLITADRLSEVYRVYVWANRQGIKVRQVISRKLLRALSYADEDDLGDDVQRMLLSNADAAGQVVKDRSTYQIMAWRSAKQGDQARMEEALQLIDRHYGNPQFAETTKSFAHSVRVLSASVRGDVEECTTLLLEEYKMEALVRDLSTLPAELHPDRQRPRSEQNRALVQAFLMADRISEAELIIERMVERRIKVSTQIFNAVLDRYVEREDVASALSLFDEMMRQQVKIDEATLNSLMKMFARSKDVESATRVLEMAFARGLSPDRRMFGSLLHAHVEAGSWQGAMDLFEQMVHHRDPRIHPSAADFNTMLRLYVVRPMPTQDTYDFLRHMIAVGFSPTHHSFTLLLVSAWDARMVELAEDIFTLAERRLGGTKGRPAGKGANAFHFTVMIQGYLRLKRLTTAHEYLGELLQRNEPVSGVLRGLIVDAYARDTEDENAHEIAQQLAKKFAADSPKDFLQVYKPLLRRAAGASQVDVVDRLIRDAGAHDVETPIPVWTELLKALRRDGNSEGTLQVWNMIFEKALDQQRLLAPSRFEPALEREEKRKLVTPSRRNMLCVPLSITIDALTHAGRHDEVAMIWIKCREHGFAFDSHNWNHLTTALLQAGRIEDACNIIEKVLNNYPPRAWRLDRVADQDPEERTVAEQGDESAPEIATRGDELPEAKRDKSDIHDEGKRRLPPFAGQTEMLFTDGVADRAQSDRPNRLRHRYPRDDPATSAPVEVIEGEEAETDEADARDFVVRLEDPEAKLEEMLGPLRARQLLDRIRSPWFAHFETMRMLYEIIEAARQRDDRIALRPRAMAGTEIAGVEERTAPEMDRFSSDRRTDLLWTSHYSTVTELLQKHPRVEELLSIFERQLEENRERERIESERDQDQRSWPPVAPVTAQARSSTQDRSLAVDRSRQSGINTTSSLGFAARTPST